MQLTYLNHKNIYLWANYHMYTFYPFCVSLRENGGLPPNIPHDRLTEWQRRLGVVLNPFSQQRYIKRIDTLVYRVATAEL